MYGLRGIAPRRLCLGGQGRDLDGARHLIVGHAEVAGGLADALVLRLSTAGKWRKLRHLVMHRPSGGNLDPPCHKLGPLDLAKLPSMQAIRSRVRTARQAEIPMAPPRPAIGP